MPLETSPLVDQILDEHAELGAGAGDLWAGYRNHAQRVFIFTRELADPELDLDDRIAVAAAFHDIMAFRSIDYIGPSVDAMKSWIDASGRPEAWKREVGIAICIHHRVRPYKGEAAELAEPFRRADWVEVSLGRLAGGVPRALINQAQQELPLGSFLTGTARRVFGHALRHPLDPLPFWRSKGSLQQVLR
jgi:hypothetical protein